MVRYFSDSAKKQAEVCGFLLSAFCLYEWMNARGGQAPVTTFKTTVSLCPLSLFCAEYLEGPFQHSPVCKPLRKQECLSIWKLKCENDLLWMLESKPENDAALVSKPYLSYRAKPFLNDLHTGGLLETPWPVNAYTVLAHDAVHGHVNLFHCHCMSLYYV